MKCRFCASPLHHSFCDLGRTPLSNSYITSDQAPFEKSYPLHAYVCEKCFLVQIGEFEKPEAIFSDYSYFSSFSDTWLAHAKRYVDEMIERFGLGAQSQVIEIASNDGYLLQYFQEKEIPVLGIEPAKNVAEAAQAKGIRTITEFFGTSLAKSLKIQGDLVLANNVLAHVPNLNDFVSGLKTILSPNGIATLEFPHLLKLIQENQFDTIYHEHFSYFSFTTVEKVFAAHGLLLFDVEELPTHGGSLRIFASHPGRAVAERVADLRNREENAGLNQIDCYLAFAKKVAAYRTKFIDLLKQLKKAGKKIAAYGAPAKGNTLLNYCGIDSSLISFTADRSPHKQGKLLPGSHIPIYAPDRIAIEKPDCVVILPWNLKEEIMQQLFFISNWGGKFIMPIPEPEVIP